MLKKITLFMSTLIAAFILAFAFSVDTKAESSFVEGESKFSTYNNESIYISDLQKYYLDHKDNRDVNSMLYCKFNNYYVIGNCMYVIDGDPITSYIDQKYFTQECDRVFFGKEYGYYIHTEKSDYSKIYGDVYYSQVYLMEFINCYSVVNHKFYDHEFEIRLIADNAFITINNNVLIEDKQIVDMNFSYNNESGCHNVQMAYTLTKDTKVTNRNGYVTVPFVNIYASWHKDVLEQCGPIVLKNIKMMAPTVQFSLPVSDEYEALYDKYYTARTCYNGERGRENSYPGATTKEKIAEAKAIMDQAYDELRAYDTQNGIKSIELMRSPELLNAQDFDDEGLTLGLKVGNAVFAAGINCLAPAPFKIPVKLATTVYCKAVSALIDSLPDYEYEYLGALFEDDLIADVYSRNCIFNTDSVLRATYGDSFDTQTLLVFDDYGNNKTHTIFKIKTNFIGEFDEYYINFDCVFMRSTVSLGRYIPIIYSEEKLDLFFTEKKNNVNTFSRVIAKAPYIPVPPTC